MSHSFKSILLASTLLLASCGGGGGGGSNGGSTPPPAPAPDTTRPTISISPTSFTVESEQTQSVTISASDNVGVTTGPDVSCTNGGVFADGVFTAPTVSEDTTSECTVTASDAAGNEASSSFTATITAPDITAPTLTVSPLSFTVRSEGTTSVTITASDDVGISIGPDVVCDNGGSFADGVFTAPMVSSDTAVNCTVTVADAAGNMATEDFTATVLVPTSFSLSGLVSKGLLLGAEIDVREITNGVIVTDAVLASSASSAMDGTFSIDVDTTGKVLGDYIAVIAKIDGANMVCDAPTGCSGGVSFGESFAIADSDAPATLLAILPTPENEADIDANLNVFTNLQGILALDRTAELGLTTLRLQDLLESRTQIAALFSLIDEDFTQLNFIDITAADITGDDQNAIKAAMLAGGVLGAAGESSNDVSTALKNFAADFSLGDGELIGREVADDPDLISLLDILQNALAIRDISSSLNPFFIGAIGDIEFQAAETDRSVGDARTANGAIQFGESTNFPPQFVTGVDYSLSVLSTSFVQILAGDIDFDPLTFTLNPSADGAFFTLSPEGQLSFAAALDFNNPSDANADNVYELVITVSDGTDARTTTIPVTVTNEAPTGFALTGVASKGLMKGGAIEVFNQSSDRVAGGTASSDTGQFTIDVADNTFGTDVLRVVADFTDVTMVCDAPRGCGTGVSFGDDFLVEDDQNGELSALILAPDGGTTRDLHINIFTQLVNFYIQQVSLEGPTPDELMTASNEVASTFNITSQDYSTLDFVDVTDPDLNPSDLDSTIAALLSAGVLGAALENPGRLENALINFYFDFGNGTFPIDDGGEVTRISLVDILTHASEIRAANGSSNTIFTQALDKIDADLAAAMTP